MISFDIDGTLETGDPPGPIEVTLVRLGPSAGLFHRQLLGPNRARAIEHVGKCRYHSRFRGLKNRLLSVRERFESDRFIHRRYSRRRSLR